MTALPPASAIPQHLRYDQSYFYTPTGRHSRITNPDPFIAPNQFAPSPQPYHFAASPTAEPIYHPSYHNDPNLPTHDHTQNYPQTFPPTNPQNFTQHYPQNSTLPSSSLNAPSALAPGYNGPPHYPSSSHADNNHSTMPVTTRQAKLQSLQRLHTASNSHSSSTSSPPPPLTISSAPPLKTPRSARAPPRARKQQQHPPQTPSHPPPSAFPSYSSPGPGHGIKPGPGFSTSQALEIRTRFPPARIKRIMQADDEIGKVAQLIPGMVGKALELFLVSLVTRAADLGPCRRLTAQMLKRAVEANGQFDFLADKVMGVPAGAEGDALGNGQGNGQGQGQGARRKRAVAEIGGEEEGGRMVKKSRESSRDDRAESEE